MNRNGINYKLVTNQQGSVRFVMLSTTGAVQQEMNYDEFGNVTVDTNPGFQPFGFAGGIYDVDTKLTRYGARDYDAEVGRWTAKDPILFEGGDTNLYSYVIQDPINFVDSKGLSQEQIDRAVDYLRRNEPDLFRKNPNPRLIDSSIPGYLRQTGITLPGGSALIDSNQCDSQDEVVGIVSHELQHIQRGFFETIFKQTQKQHDMINQRSAEIQYRYGQNQ